MEGTLIIAEAGVNHNGSFETAKALVRVAKECGADIVKFQTIYVENLVSKHAMMADYQRKNLGTNDSQKEMLRKLVLKEESHSFQRRLIFTAFICWSLFRTCGRSHPGKSPTIHIWLR